VADTGNNRVVVLSYDGHSFAYLTQYTASLSGPTGLAVDAADNLYIADTVNNRIVVLSPAGDFLRVYTGPNDGSQGGFDKPYGVAVRADGVMLVADTGNARVVRIYPTLKVLLPLVARMGY